jgi:hypothetical protein
MPVTAGPIYPGVKKGLVFAIDPANKDSWAGPTSATVDSLTLYNAASGSIVNDTSGSYGNTESFTFDGTDDDMRFETGLNSSIHAPKTISFWYYTTNGSQVGQIMSKAAADFEIYQHTNGNAIWTYYGSSSPSTKPSVVTNTWTNLTYVWDTSTSPYTTQHTYQNGELLISPQMSGADSFSNTGQLTLGKRALSTTQYWEGDLGPILIYNRQLSASEVLQNYNALKGRFGLS